MATIYRSSNGNTTKKVTEYGVPLSDYSKKTTVYTGGYLNGGPGSFDESRTTKKKTYIDVDVDAYNAAQKEWMDNNAAFAGWTDDDKSAFLNGVQTNNWNTQQAQAAQMWTNYQVGLRNSNEQKKQDRADMLAEIEAYKAGFSNEAISTALAAERQALDVKIQQTLEQAVSQAAAQGRVMDNTTYAMLRGRLEAQAANVLQQAQMGYEQKRQEYAYQAMQAKMDVYKNSQDTMMSPTELTSIIQAMAGKK